MAQPATNPKIEELRFKVKTDAKSRLFYPLAEELRKIGQVGEAEQVLRTGLTHHATYLSAWVSLGRVLRDQHKDREAVDALTKALQLDPGNVVAARLLADAYLNLGEKVEAIKKYKLVYAQLPGDEDLEAVIQRLDAEINAPQGVAAAPPPTAPQPPPPPPSPSPVAIAPTASPAAESGDVFDITYSRMTQGGVHADASPFAEAERELEREQKRDVETADAEPMRAAHAESPFEEPGADAGYGFDAFSVEQPGGMQISNAPLAAELPSPVFDDQADTSPQQIPPELSAAPPPPSADDEDEGIYVGNTGVAPGFITDQFSANIAPPPPDPDDFARTISMADLYANQGLIDEARDIYEDVLLRDPSNASVRAKLEALESAAPAASYEEEPPAGDDAFESEAAGDAFSPAEEVEPSRPSSFSETMIPEGEAIIEPPADDIPEPFGVPSDLPVEPAFGEPEADVSSGDVFSRAGEPFPSDEPAPAMAAEDTSSGHAPVKPEKIEKLQSWLAKVGKKEAPRV